MAVGGYQVTGGVNTGPCLAAVKLGVDGGGCEEAVLYRHIAVGIAHEAANAVGLIARETAVEHAVAEGDLVLADVSGKSATGDVTALREIEVDGHAAVLHHDGGIQCLHQTAVARSRTGDGSRHVQVANGGIAHFGKRCQVAIGARRIVGQRVAVALEDSLEGATYLFGDGDVDVQ